MTTKEEKLLLFYKKTVDQLMGNVYCKDINCKYIFCNDNFSKILGLENCEYIQGKSDYDFLPCDQAKIVEQIDITVLKQRKEIIVEEEGFDENKKQAVYLSIKKPIVDDEDNVIGLIGISIDITERKKAEQLAVEHKILEEKLIAQQINNKYVGIMAHELRTPIATFKLYADLIKSVIQNPEMSFEDKQNNIVELVEKCYEVEKSSTQFIDMILYRLRSTNNKLDPARFDLCLIADDIEDVLDTYAFGSGERALITVKKANAFTYKGDSVATKHIVSNLIKNTLKIIKEEDKGKITISFDQSDEKYNKMIFEDDAKGIDEKFLPLIFDSFVYKDSTGKGTGLGLAFCKMIMVDYGGDIICESELGKYTRFICLFPKVDMNEFDFA